MLRRIGRIIPAAAVMGLFAATGLQAQEPAELPAPEAEECRLQVNTDVPIDAEPVVIEAAYSELIGETLRAMLEEESGVQVVAIEEGAEPLSLLLTLDTQHAEEGEWSIALEGEGGECRGKVVVARHDPEPDPEDY